MRAGAGGSQIPFRRWNSIQDILVVEFTMTLTLSLDPTPVAEQGERIYHEKYKDSYERDHHGQFVAIDVNTAKAYLADESGDAIERALQDSPNGIFHLIRVGSPAAFLARHMSHRGSARSQGGAEAGSH